MDLGINQSPAILEEEDEEGAMGSRMVAVAVAVDKDKNSDYAVKWALDRLISRGDTLVLIHWGIMFQLHMYVTMLWLLTCNKWNHKLMNYCSPIYTYAILERYKLRSRLL